MKENKPLLLLHICCVGCGVYISRELNADYDVTLFFYNPNIYPCSEYELRLEEAQKIAEQHNLPIMIGAYDHEQWRRTIAGFESEPEKGKRCRLCYKMRLEKTALVGAQNGFAAFASTLSMSPHKDARLINEIGTEISKELAIKYLASDFKKNDGFKNSVLLARELNLYRQNYCGCEFSIRKLVN